MITSLLVLLVAAGPSDSAENWTYPAPHLLGGAVIAVLPGGRLVVRDPGGGTDKWSVQIGETIDHVAADEHQVFIASGRFVRAFSEGKARWSLDAGSPVQGLHSASGQLKVVLSGGGVYIDADNGRFCTPRTPCSGLPAWNVGSVGVPFLDLANMGMPGLGLLLNPSLLEQGDRLGAMVSPGVLPGWGTAPPARLAPPAPVMAPCVDGESCEDGDAGDEPGRSGVRMRKGPSGKVRGMRLGTVSVDP